MEIEKRDVIDKGNGIYLIKDKEGEGWSVTTKTGRMEDAEQLQTKLLEKEAKLAAAEEVELAEKMFGVTDLKAYKAPKKQEEEEGG